VTALLLLALAAAPARVSGEELARTIEQSLAGTQIHLDRGKQRSFAQLPAAYGGQRSEFTLPDHALELGAAGRVTYRVCDVNLEKLTIVSAGSAFVLTLRFEDQGKELLSHHGGGMLDIGGLVPDFHVDGIRVDATLTPAQRTAPAFTSAKVGFDASIAPDGPAGVLRGGIDSFKKEIRAVVERELQAFANQVMLPALNQYLRRHSGMHFEGVDLVPDAPAAPPLAAAPKAQVKARPKAKARKK
jgi:hypothetical protein